MFSVSSSLNKRKRFMLFSRKNIFSAKPSICIIFSTIYKNPTKHWFRTSVDQQQSLLEKQHCSVNFTIDQSFQPANCDNWIFIILLTLDLYPSGLFPHAKVFIEVGWVGINQLGSVVFFLTIILPVMIRKHENSRPDYNNLWGVSHLQYFKWTRKMKSAYHMLNMHILRFPQIHT